MQMLPTPPSSSLYQQASPNSLNPHLGAILSSTPPVFITTSHHYAALSSPFAVVLSFAHDSLPFLLHLRHYNPLLPRLPRLTRLSPHLTFLHY